MVKKKKLFKQYPASSVSVISGKASVVENTFYPKSAHLVWGLGCKSL